MHIETFQPAQADAVADLIRRNLVEIISRYYSPDYVAYLINLYTMSRHLERVGDHSTNIAEEVIYLIEGEIVRHGRWEGGSQGSSR